MYSFKFQRAESVADAVKVLQSDDDAKLLSGGMTLLPTMKLRLARPSQLIDLTHIDELKRITVSGDSVIIGAAVRHHDVESSAEIAKAIPALCGLAGGIGDAQVITILRSHLNM